MRLRVAFGFVASAILVALIQFPLNKTLERTWNWVWTQMEPDDGGDYLGGCCSLPSRSDDSGKWVTDSATPHYNHRKPK
jgi:hypothetical protein